MMLFFASTSHAATIDRAGSARSAPPTRRHLRARRVRSGSARRPVSADEHQPLQRDQRVVDRPTRPVNRMKSMRSRRRAHVAADVGDTDDEPQHDRQVDARRADSCGAGAVAPKISASPSAGANGNRFTASASTATDDARAARCASTASAADREVRGEHRQNEEAEVAENHGSRSPCRRGEQARAPAGAPPRGREDEHRRANGRRRRPRSASASRAASRDGRCARGRTRRSRGRPRRVAAPRRGMPRRRSGPTVSRSAICSRRWLSSSSASALVDGAAAKDGGAPFADAGLGVSLDLGAHGHAPARDGEVPESAERAGRGGPLLAVLGELGATLLGDLVVLAAPALRRRCPIRPGCARAARAGAAAGRACRRSTRPLRRRARARA